MLKNKAPNPGEVRCLRCALRALASGGKTDAQRATSRLDGGTRGTRTLPDNRQLISLGCHVQGMRPRMRPNAAPFEIHVFVSSMVTGMVSRFVFAFCLVNFIEGMGNLVQ